MNYRLNKTAIGVVVALTVIAAALFTYTLVSAPAATEEQAAEQSGQERVQKNLVVSAKHQYRDGIHTIAGRVMVPTPCHTVSVEPFVEGDTRVELRMTSVVKEDGCEAKETEVPFSVTFRAPEKVSIILTWDGAQVRLNLVPVLPGESIDTPVPFKG